jgi:hypothetical protein
LKIKRHFEEPGFVVYLLAGIFNWEDTLKPKVECEIFGGMLHTFQIFLQLEIYSIRK